MKVYGVFLTQSEQSENFLIFSKKIIDKQKIKLYNMQVLFEGQLNIAELCKGSTADSDSVCLGSNPSSATKNTINGFSRWWYFFCKSRI